MKSNEALILWRHLAIPSSSPALTTGFAPSSPRINPSAALVHSQLVCLLPVEILDMLSLFQYFVSLDLKSLRGERSIKYSFIHLLAVMKGI